MKISERALWMTQALSGVLLVALLGLHWVAQHYVARGGLRTYQQVLAYVGHPLVGFLEALFLLVVTGHAALGLRSMALDWGLSDRAMSRVNRVLLALVVLAVGYGWWLLGRLVFRAFGMAG